MISVIVSTFNRCESLKETLESICRQKLVSGIDHELVVVDNNSTDRTREVVEEAAKQAPLPVRYVFEAQQGISKARNRGIRESWGQYLIFTDDDVKPEAQWIESIYQAFLEYDADIVAGKIKPLWAKEPPAWVFEPEFKETLGGVFALLDHGPEPFVLTKLDLNFCYGANMAFRKTALDKLGGFREDLGMVGKKRLYGEDTEMIIRYFNAGKKMVYAPDAVVCHKVPAERINLKYVRKWRFDKALTLKPESAGRFPPFWLLKECCKNGMLAFAALASGNQKRAIQKELQFWTQCGQIAGILKR
jgi:GT2 family glycosyltransferase